MDKMSIPYERFVHCPDHKLLQKVEMLFYTDLSLDNQCRFNIPSVLFIKLM